MPLIRRRTRRLLENKTKETVTLLNCQVVNVSARQAQAAKDQKKIHIANRFLPASMYSLKAMQRTDIAKFYASTEVYGMVYH